MTATSESREERRMHGVTETVNVLLLDTLPDEIGEWPRTPAAEAAVAFAAEHSPAYLLNHCIRSFFYARSIAAAKDLVAGTDYDEETLFLATVLHDIGLTGEGQGPNRFEVDGAFRAARFARDHGLSDAAAELIWDAVALHTSSGIAVHKQPVVALAHLGIGADVFGFGVEELDRAVLDAAHSAFPWLDLRERILEEVVHQIDQQPSKWSPMSFVDDVYRKFRPDNAFPGLDEMCAAPTVPH
ncbi:HD domain-containing protein [Streptomyces sp. CB00455]|uniref:HD domain-containing protein n=1 Tax=Streptomyces sp. CB00455 TaxID=1703927 RepID=UPI0009A119D2|nr:HD domain-containing protein [Streptomyces sp. CB00455]